MEDRNTQPRSGLPLTHQVIALFFAVAAAGLLWFWLSKRATDSASAVLEFDPSLAQNFDPDLVFARKPAIALADSILDDQAIAGLAKQSRQSSSANANEIGQFRSSLELSQPSSTVLMVQFLASDSDRSAANANAVAQALAAWNPSKAVAPAAAANSPPVGPPPQPAPLNAPAHNAPAEGQSHPSPPVSGPSLPLHSLSNSLGEIGAELSATDQDLDRLAGEPDTGRSPQRNAQSVYTEFKQQQLLKAQVNAAEKKLDDLRAQFGEGDTDPDVKGRLASVQQALDSILRGGDPFAHSAEASGFKTAGITASQLRWERSQLSHAISVVSKERQAIEQAEATHSASDRPSQAPPPSAPAPSSTAQTSPSVQQTPPPADSGTAAPQHPAEHPLSLVRFASPTPPASPWPAVLAGFVSGLLYLSIAAWAHRRVRSDEDYEEENTFPNRLITPDVAVDTPGEYGRDSDPPATRTEPAEAESTLRRRAPFAFDAADERAAPRRTAFLWDHNDEALDGTREEPHLEAGQSASPGEGNAKSAETRTDQLRKSLSETSFGRMFEGASADAAGTPQQHRQQQSQSPDRH